MKKIYCFFVIVYFLEIAFLFTACNLLYGEKKADMNIKDYYVVEDFNSIIIGESSYKDVYEIAALDSIQITSYGGFCEYPMKDGRIIRIEFTGKDLIVSNIKIVKPKTTG